MKRGTLIILGMIGAWACHAADAAGPPPLDRPSPPPCCADGLCYPNPMTWGHYATRWRRWPGVYLEPLPPELRPPAPLGPDIRPFEPPPAEEEDRRAPPPTAPRAEPEAEDQAPAPPPRGPATETPPTGPLAPPTPGPPRTTFPFDEPEGAEQPPPAPLPFDTAPPPTTLPFGGEPPTTLPFGEPMGDFDPPPTPPFGSPAKGRSPATRAAANPVGKPTHRQADSPRRSGDPRPAMPIAMAY